eukprot:TRINITY_DN49688_c0_g1_i1.p1 TRINITY_DN49688_c0_g1~~TRINITY_DN49688_c0_g1_i1.p1  ORF type:complete len:497 (-),score=-38.72 TRINITY_DN49688_c0_g1_i1:220-1710(-)
MVANVASGGSMRSGSMSIKRSSMLQSDGGSISPTNSSSHLHLQDGSPVRTSPSRSGNGSTPPRAVDELPADLPSPVSGKVRGSPMGRRGGGGGASPNNRSMLRTSGGTALPLMPASSSSPQQVQQTGGADATSANSNNSPHSGSDVVGNPTAKEMENVAAFPKRLRCMLGRLSPSPGGSNSSSGDIAPPTLSPPRSSSPGLTHQHPAAPPQRGGNNSRSRGPSSEATSPSHSLSPSNPLLPSTSVPTITPTTTVASSTSTSGGTSSSAGGQVIPVLMADEETVTEGLDYGSPSRELNPPTTLNSTAASPEKTTSTTKGLDGDRTASPVPDPTEQQPSSETVARPPSSEPTAMFARRRASLEIANEMVITSSGGGGPPLVPTKPKGKPQSAASVSSSSARPVGRDAEGPRAESAPSPSQMPTATSSPRTGRNGTTTASTSSAINSGVRPVSPNRGPTSSGASQPSNSSAPRATSPVSAPSRTSGGRASRTTSESNRQ